jgi:hypothetical protein
MSPSSPSRSYRPLAEVLPDGRRGYYPAARSDLPKTVTPRDYHAERHGRALAIGFILLNLALIGLYLLCA